MKVLIIGNAYSGFNTSFTWHLKELDAGIEVDVLNYYYEAALNKRKIKNDPYNHIYHYYSDVPGYVSIIPKLKYIYWKFRAMQTIRMVKKKISDYQVILIQGFWAHGCEIYFSICNSSVYTVGAFWGSDFYKCSNYQLVQRTADRCHKVIISTQSMEADVRKKIALKADKVANCLFGVQPLEQIFKLLPVSKDISKEKLGVNKGLKVITCGYNGKVYQQHLAIINQLTIIKDQLVREKVFLLFPMTYGSNQPYLSSIESALDRLGVQYKIIRDFMSDDEVAHLRKATDIFIQVQTTDANSGSMREHLCCQNIVVTGSWLPYEHLTDDDIFFETVNSVDGLSKKLEYILNNYDRIETDVARKNTPDKFKKSLWSEAVKDWYNVLNSYKRYTS